MKAYLWLLWILYLCVFNFLQVPFWFSTLSFSLPLCFHWAFSLSLFLLFSFVADNFIYPYSNSQNIQTVKITYYSDRLILCLFFKGPVEIACFLKTLKIKLYGSWLFCFLSVNILTIKNISYFLLLKYTPLFTKLLIKYILKQQQHIYATPRKSVMLLFGILLKYLLSFHSTLKPPIVRLPGHTERKRSCFPVTESLEIWMVHPDVMPCWVMYRMTSSSVDPLLMQALYGLNLCRICWEECFFPFLFYEFKTLSTQIISRNRNSRNISFRKVIRLLIVYLLGRADDPSIKSWRLDYRVRMEAQTFAREWLSLNTK